MKDTKLIEILNTFSNKEMKSFEKLVASPYFERQRDVSGLFSLLKKHYPDFDSGSLEKGKVYSKLFPGEKLNEKKLKNITFELTKLAEQFLIHSSVSRDKIECERLLALQYKERKREKLFSLSIKSLEKKIDELLFDSVTCFSEKEKVIRLKEEFYIGKNRFDESIVLRNEYTEYFTLSFLILFLRKLRDREVIKDGYGTPLDNVLFNSMYKIADFKKLLSLLKKEKYPMLWVIEMYYYAFLSAENLDDEKSFYKFKKLFDENMGKFSRKEKYYILSDFISFCVRNENRGKSKYEYQEFEVYKQMIKQDAYSSSKKEYLNIVLYRNMMFLALSLKEYEWLGQLVEEFAGKLKPEYRESMRNFAGAHLDFATGNFEKALESIGKVRYDLFYYKLDVKNLLLRIYYELDLFDQAFSLIDAYKHYLKENKEFPPEYILQFQNFIGIYNKLLKAKSDGKKGDPDKLIEDINQIKALAARGWILKKVTELQKEN